MKYKKPVAYLQQALMWVRKENSELLGECDREAKILVGAEKVVLVEMDAIQDSRHDVYLRYDNESHSDDE